MEATKPTPEQIEENRGKLIMKATKAYEDLLGQLMNHPVDVVILSVPKITKKRITPAIATYAPGQKVYAMLIDSLKVMTDDMEDQSSKIEGLDGKRIQYDPKLKH